MGEQWKLVNIDKNEYQDFGKLIEFFFSAQDTILLRLMIPSVAIDPRPVNRQFLAFLERIGRKPYEPKESLPGSWAGDRLICFGKYGDLPEGIITQREAKRLTEIAKTEAYLEKDPYGREHPECLLHARILDRSASKPLPLMPDYDLPREHINDPNIVWTLRNLSKKEFAAKAAQGSHKRFSYE
ncbi:hypothetical protein M413DRAFT_29909 [Hebeloma cylindrosporum]|uniref:Uncharacterized protein n=1 Tax=Hebeloma cylindrosporum TaxID=76867 RepID=A0A0C3C511_HEBCY|nr:hypothetical protein M413DRAFT_29909 [Hebeloma cylindrosporum h7]